MSRLDSGCPGTIAGPEFPPFRRWSRESSCSPPSLELVIDDEKHPDALKGPSRRTGALYAFIAPEPPAGAAAGKWHTGRLVVRNSRIEHWVNGVRLLAADVAEPEVYAMIKKRWSGIRGAWDHYDERAEKPSPISLQN